MYVRPVLVVGWSADRRKANENGGGRDRMPSFNAHTTFRYPEDKKDLVEKARKMAGSKGLNGLQLETFRGVCC